MVTALIPGPVSRRLFAEGLPAIEAFAEDLVKNVIGSRARVEARATTHWQSDPFARGSYAYSRVGHSNAREIYAQPVDDRLFFTGDGADDPLAVTVGGAWRNGQKTARSVARLLGAKGA
jgi:monoamine oxidase